MTLSSKHTSQLKKLSKFLSFILRHQPDAIGLQLDGQGWADIEQLLQKANRQGKTELTRQLLQQIVDTNDKKRFIISEDGKRIRANQGHSVKIDLNLQPLEPPQTLYHGTASRFIDSIMAQGLKPGKRNHVHLSADRQTATAVGQRYGKPVILIVDSQAMHHNGFQFYQAANGVWLTEAVPIKYLNDEAD